MKEKVGGCCESCDEVRGELGLGSVGGGGAKEQIVTRAEDAIGARIEKKGSRSQTMVAL